ncbi:hypothetical protein N657DRAFT_356056 [Parathielavia appendiculata]|uniref:Uncharacterized protein n=1 Tax=Parathielavia appendiculata TaxID=2587402 RepID=A0AAN6Z4V8_9PEZI|nr:hypothetical protein N657DRAFT_356056 [Parathielavia appendiculata]
MKPSRVEFLIKPKFIASWFPRGQEVLIQAATCPLQPRQRKELAAGAAPWPDQSPSGTPSCSIWARGPWCLPASRGSEFRRSHLACQATPILMRLGAVPKPRPRVFFISSREIWAVTSIHLPLASTHCPNPPPSDRERSQDTAPLRNCFAVELRALTAAVELSAALLLIAASHREALAPPAHARPKWTEPVLVCHLGGHVELHKRPTA